MTKRRPITAEQAWRAGGRVGLDWSQTSLAQFRRGLEMELERGPRNLRTKTPDDDLVRAGRIALTHLKRVPDYYSRLDGLEAEAANEAESAAYAYRGK